MNPPTVTPSVGRDGDRLQSESATLATAAKGMEWSIELAGRAKYRFAMGRINRILPRQELLVIKIPDATPEIIAAYAMTDEQALLAKVRYNRLIDIFLGLTLTPSRTTSGRQ